MNIILRLIKIFPPEASHKIALLSLDFLYKTRLLNQFFPKFNNQKIDFFGMSLSNRLGTAAGLDKDGDYIDCLGALGFGFLEVGTVTPLAQFGNPKPRVFRIFKEKAVINRLGFNNKGVDYLVKRLKNRKYKGIVGVNIGANKNSKDQKRIDDYIECFRKVYKYSDYITVNISSPNTPGLRDLHDLDNIKNLILNIENEAKLNNFNRPIFLKISPDESAETIKSIADLINLSNLTGLIISNTTIDKEILHDKKNTDIDGGLSGAPLMKKSTEILKAINNHNPELPIIGVGGVMCKSDFNEKINSGASLVQIYTGFIINGPKIVSKILN